MANISVLIIEDEELYANKLEMMVDMLDYDLVGIVDNSEDALALIRKTPPDLIISDINIEGAYDGIELADLIHQETNIPIIFITSLKDDRTFKRASRTKPIGFLTKPFDDLQLQRSVELVVQQLAFANTEETAKKPTPQGENWNNDVMTDQHIFVKVRNKLEKLSLIDIAFLEADGKYCTIHTVKKKYLVRLAMSKLQDKLSQTNFLRTHRSFIVNKSLITSIDLEDSVVYIGEKHVPLSKRERENVLKEMNWI